MQFIKPLNTPGAEVAAVTSALLIAQQVAGKATRDALFLSAFGASYLPFAMATGAVLSLGAVLWLSRLMSRHPPRVIMPVLFAISAFGFAAEWLLELSAPRAAALLVYLHTALFGPATISTFWSLINESFDPHAAKRAVARIAGGGTLGGVLGGLTSWRASTLVRPATVLLILAILNGLAVVGTLWMRARRAGVMPAPVSNTDRPSSAETESALGALRAMPFLRNLGLLVALGAATSAILDYLFSVQAVAEFGKGPALLSFFSLFWLGVGVLSFLLQLSVGRVALEKLGLAVSIAVLPGLIILGGAFGLAMPGLVSASTLRASDAVQRNTLFRSAYELLYTPIPEERKRATKALIDVGCDRLGTVVGSGLALLALAAFSRSPGPILLGAVVVLALATLPLTRQLHVGYVTALEQQLREGAAENRITTYEALTRASLIGSPQSERDHLVEQIEDFQPGGLTALLETSNPETREQHNSNPGVLTRPPPPAEAQLGELQHVLSTNAVEVRQALEHLQPRGPAVASAILLLAHQDFHQAAVTGLAAIASSITGQLVDSLLDPSLDFVIRRRIPRALRNCSTQRAADGLLLGLGDERFEVRYECGRALVKVTSVQADLTIPREKVFEAIQRELQAGKRLLSGMTSHFDEDPHGDEQHALVDSLMRDRVDRTLEHVFTILSLNLEREPLRMAFRALHHQNTAFRGTALEYLDTVLPAEIRHIVWPYLGEAAPLPTARSPRELLAELARAGT